MVLEEVSQLNEPSPVSFESNTGSSSESDITVSSSDQEYLPQRKAGSSKHNIQEEEVSEEEKVSKRQDNPNYVKGEDINLLDGKKLFVATYSHCNIGTTVHHKPVTRSCGRFIIKEVLRACQEWLSYDNDFHVANAYILWPYKYTKKYSVQSIIGTHAKSATL